MHVKYLRGTEFESLDPRVFGKLFGLECESMGSLKGI